MKCNSVFHLLTTFLPSHPTNLQHQRLHKKQSSEETKWDGLETLETLQRWSCLPALLFSCNCSPSSPSCSSYGLKFYILSFPFLFSLFPPLDFLGGVGYQTYSNSKDCPEPTILSVYINFYVFSLHVYRIISRFSSPINTSLPYCDYLAIIAFWLHYIFLKFKMHSFPKKY